MKRWEDLLDHDFAVREAHRLHRRTYLPYNPHHSRAAVGVPALHHSQRLRSFQEKVQDFEHHKLRVGETEKKENVCLDVDVDVEDCHFQLGAAHNNGVEGRAKLLHRLQGRLFHGSRWLIHRCECDPVSPMKF